MSQFKDAQGREWTVRIDVNALRAVRDALDFDLLSKRGVEQLGDLAADPILLVATLYVLCKDQIAERELSEKVFAAALYGDAIAEAVDALLEGLIAFFPERQRRALMAVMARIDKVQATAMDKVEAALESGAMDQMIEDQITSGLASTSSPESPGSPPAP